MFDLTLIYRRLIFASLVIVVVAGTLAFFVWRAVSRRAPAAAALAISRLA